MPCSHHQSRHFITHVSSFYQHVTSHGLISCSHFTIVYARATVSFCTPGPVARVYIQQSSASRVHFWQGAHLVSMALHWKHFKTFESPHVHLHHNLLPLPSHVQPCHVLPLLCCSCLHTSIKRINKPCGGSAHAFISMALQWVINQLLMRSCSHNH